MSKTRPLPSQDYLVKVLDYDPLSGLLYWKHRDASLFLAPRYATCWNVRFAGKEALSYVNNSGYKVGDIDGIKYGAHRVIWMLVNGIEPQQIDHANGIKTDNRIENLRSVSPAENNKNHPMKRRNKSGCIGVRWYPKTASWQASIGGTAGREFLGYFKSLEDASEARRKAEVRLGYHPNHGRQHEAGRDA